MISVVIGMFNPENTIAFSFNLLCLKCIFRLFLVNLLLSTFSSVLLPANQVSLRFLSIDKGLEAMIKQRCERI